MSHFVSIDDLTQIDFGDGEWVKIPARLSYGFLEQADSFDGSEIAKTTKFLSLLIKEWSLKEADGSVPKITDENIRRLDFQTIKQIMKEVTPLISLEKKKLQI